MNAVLTRVRGIDPALLGRRLAAALTGTIAVSIFCALAAVAVLLLIIGQNPFEVYAAMLEGALTGRGLVTTLQRATPLIGLAIALVYSFRAGVFNLGGEGQFVLGALVGTTVALTLPGPGPLVALLACLAAVAAGAGYASIPGLIQTKLGPSVLITSLLLNYIALAFVSWAISLLKDPQSSEQATPAIAEGARIPALIPADSTLGAALGASLGGQNVLVLATRGLNWSIIVVIAIVLLTIFFNRRTVTGFESGAVGLNALFAQNVGIRSDRVVMTSLMIGGGISGLIGIMLVLGFNYRLIDGELPSTGYAITALLVVLLGRSTPGGVVFAGFFFTVLAVGGEQLNRSFQLPQSIAQIIQALVIFFAVLRLGIPWVTDYFRERAASSRLAAAAREERGSK